MGQVSQVNQRIGNTMPVSYLSFEMQCLFIIVSGSFIVAQKCRHASQVAQRVTGELAMSSLSKEFQALFISGSRRSIISYISRHVPQIMERGPNAALVS